MKKNHALSAVTLPLAMTMLGVGCAAPFHEDETKTDAAATSGLLIEEQRSDLVRGTFTREGSKIDFSFSVEENVHHAKIWDGDGPILESKLANGHEDTTYLGGKARVQGGLFDEKPVIEGDQQIFEALNAHPSARLFFTVRDALVEAGVSRDLVSVSRKSESASGIKPQYRDVGRYAIHPYHSVSIPTTWQAWVYTRFTLYSASYPYPWAAGCVQAQTGWSPWVCSGSFQGTWSTGARYYGYNVRVFNNQAPINGFNPLLGVHHEEL